MRGRKWTGEVKLAIVLEGLKGAKPVAEICREHQIAQTQYYQWRDRFLEGGRKALANGVRETEVGLQREIAQLKRIIGEQTVVIEVLKKTDALMKGW